jgi:hypothetical protein
VFEKGSWHPHSLLKMIEVTGRTPSQQARMATTVITRMIAVHKKSVPRYSRVPVPTQREKNKDNKQMLLVDRGSPRNDILVSFLLKNSD